MKENNNYNRELGGAEPNFDSGERRKKSERIIQRGGKIQDNEEKQEKEKEGRE